MTNSKTYSRSRGVLTGEQIKDLKIIVLDNEDDYDKTCYDKASYNLRLGAHYYRPNINGDKESHSCELDENPHCPHREYALKNKIEDCNLNNRVLIIKPYTSVVISTFETLKLPPNVVGRFDLKIRWALQGLILQVGTQVAPGYEGRLFGLLHNLSKKEICIPMKFGILDAEFSFISAKVEPQKFDKTYSTLEGFLKSRPPIEGTLEAFLQDVESEKEQMIKWKGEVGNLKDSINGDLKDYKSEISRTLEGYKSTSINEFREFKTEINNTVQEYKTTAETIKNEIISARNTGRSITLGIAIAIITISFSIGIPLITTKLTFDKDDYPIQQLMNMDTKNKAMYNTMDSVIKVNKESMQLLIQSNQLANDSINSLIVRIELLERKLKEKTLKSSKNGK
jgi:deoxycytidine triphosphate deaminase